MLAKVQLVAVAQAVKLPLQIKTSICGYFGLVAEPKKRPWILIPATLLVLSGLAILGNSLYDLTFGDDSAGQKQQVQAETVPLVEPEGSGGSLKVGEVFAKLYAPRLGKDYVRNIAEGTSVTKVLNNVGIGHYVSTQLPGEVGNFALAAHRNGNGGPFRNIDKFVAGDEVVIETASAKYTYRYLQTKVVEPNDLGVISKNPSELTVPATSGKYLTLTTCTPIYINTQRLIVWFALVGESKN